jgi:mediator of RNA polymerase II transcription subunit 8
VRKRGEHDYDDEDTYPDADDDDAPSDPFSEQWAEMQDCFQQTLQQYVTVQVKKKYTVEEQAMGVERVRTGLKQTLEESDDEEDDDEDEDEEEEEEEEAAAAAGGAGAPAVGAGGPGAAGGQVLGMIAPEHIFYLQATGNPNLPKNVPIESRRIQTGPTRRVAPPR